ncbi:C4-dicarboxylate ABC transporter permease [Salipaludibacillus neizhouensis]|uniref:C4-dicarboxylate ABC transporter permease n=1 Tax=Salipaludibacillus neizhouensis TaxID=885475 RepID=A0A3A9KU01_9BACI|nr:TRAP transporter permease [Salipaludibacillus neizhouensis]RKL68086.1 C4-dicarboxylate ABC transporter permease [Salipaludibacillus neizhouensis]
MEKSTDLKGNTFFTVERCILFLAISLAIFHLYTASFGILPGYFQSAVHWALVASVIFLVKPLKFRYSKYIDVSLILISWYISYYLITVQKELVMRAGAYTDLEVLLGILAILIGLEAGRRTVGLILPLFCLAFLLYALFGSYFPGMLQTANFSMTRIAPYLYTGSDGLYGQIILVSAQFIFLFLLFGAVLKLTGAGTFFVDLAYSVAGKVSGGPAQAAILSSMLMGTVNGSGAANVVTTGTFTIPLMKKVGFKPKFAGAVEAVASNGGQIMPPVMGAVAFLMAEITGMPYTDILKAALIPAILYFVTLSSCVYLIAKKNNFKGLQKSELPSFRKTLFAGWLYLLPLFILVILLVQGFSPQRSAFFSIILAFIIGFIKDRKNMKLPNIISALRDAATGIMPIAAACLLAGVIMGVIQLTGLGIKISGILEAVAGGNLLYALVLTMLTSIILGMGLPTSAAYLILAVLVAPALVNMGIPLIAAHLFILYFGALSTITPPVALSVFGAAGIAGSNVWETGIESVKLASAGFIIPFIFAYNDVLLLNGSLSEVSFSVATALIGCLSLSVAVTGWCIKTIGFVRRVLFLVGAIFLIIPSPFYWSLIGFVMVSMIIATIILSTNKSNSYPLSKAESV